MPPEPAAETDATDPDPSHRHRRRAIAVLTLALGLAIATAQPASRDAAVAIGRVPGLPVWLIAVSEPARGGPPSAAVLLADGTMWWVGPAGSVRLASGLGGEQAERCGTAILAVDAVGRLRRFARAPDLPVAAGTGPEVSLLHRPACLDGLRATSDAPSGASAVVDPVGDVLVLDRDLTVRARAAGLRALPDAELVVVDPGGDGEALAVLVEPTQRYRHGTLGDEVEAGAVVLLGLPSLVEIARWSVVAPAVIEARRPTPWVASGDVGLHVTVSDDARGARLVTLALDGASLSQASAGDPLGRRGQWLHVVAAAADRAYALHLPHRGGQLVRYQRRAEGIDGEAWALVGAPASLGLASHVLGERNLDRAAWVRELAAGVDLLAIPRADMRRLAWVRCDASSCRVVHETLVDATLATNLEVVRSAERDGVVAADVEGVVWWLPLPRALGR